MPRSCADAGRWEPFMGYVRGLQCRECKAEYPPVRLAVCESCFGPLEVRYEIDAVRGAFRRDVFGDRPATLWRYRELLPVFDDQAIVDLAAGDTPLRRGREPGGGVRGRGTLVQEDTGQPNKFFQEPPGAGGGRKGPREVSPAGGWAAYRR